MADCFKKHDRDRRRKIQAARAVHGNGKQPIRVCFEQPFRETFGFPAEDKKITGPKARRVIRAIAFGREIKVTPYRILRGLQRA